MSLTGRWINEEPAHFHPKLRTSYICDHLVEQKEIDLSSWEINRYVFGGDIWEETDYLSALNTLIECSGPSFYSVHRSRRLAEGVEGLDGQIEVHELPSTKFYLRSCAPIFRQERRNGNRYFPDTFALYFSEKSFHEGSIARAMSDCLSLGKTEDCILFDRHEICPTEGVYDELRQSDEGIVAYFKEIDEVGYLIVLSKNKLQLE